MYKPLGCRQCLNRMAAIANAFAALWLAITLSAPHDALARRPAAKTNFLVILCDDLGYGDLGCYGNRIIKTPNLDRLAAEGMKLTDCYAAAPVCSPSRAGMLTGRTPCRVGVYDWIPAGSPVHLRPSEITVATLLKAAGYVTCHVGKWHCNGLFNSRQQPQPGDHGFDHWFSTQNNAIPSHRNPKNFVRNGRPVGRLEGFSSSLVVNEAIRWLDSRPDKDKPFCLFVWFHEPHEPIDSPEKFLKLYPDATKKGQALYYANVTQMDHEVGRLLKTLDERNLRDDTLVFFTSDNGPETLNRYRGAWRSHGSPGPLRGMKLHLYEGGIRVPGIIRWPGETRPGQLCREPVIGSDVLPTFCAIAGIKPPADRALDGADFSPIFEGKPVKRKTPLYWQYHRSIGKPKVAMRQGDWKILAHWDVGSKLRPGGGLRAGDQEILARTRLSAFELYNLREDLAETDNLAEEYPQRLKQMAQTLTKLFNEVRDEGPTWIFPKKK